MRRLRRGGLPTLTDDTDLYTVTVPYTHADCCRSYETEATFDVRAKNPEEASHLAKRAVEATSACHFTFNTTVEEP